MYIEIPSCKFCQQLMYLETVTIKSAAGDYPLKQWRCLNRCEENRIIKEQAR